MKKTISLMPKDAKKRVEVKNIKKYGALFITIPVLVTIYNLGTNVIKNEELNRLKENQQTASGIKTQISTVQSDSQHSEELIRSLELSGVPLNKFMLYLGTELPNDIRIYEVTKDISASSGTQQTTVENGEVPSESIPEAEAMIPTEDVNKTENEGELKTENIGSSGGTIIVKGAGLKVDSVAKFVESLKTNTTYIKSVEISDIQNYKNEEFNYKMFEMEINLR